MTKKEKRIRVRPVHDARVHPVHDASDTRTMDVPMESPQQGLLSRLRSLWSRAFRRRKRTKLIGRVVNFQETLSGRTKIWRFALEIYEDGTPKRIAIEMRGRDFTWRISEGARIGFYKPRGWSEDSGKVLRTQWAYDLDNDVVIKQRPDVRAMP
jgi:hypothetical protein